MTSSEVFTLTLLLFRAKVWKFWINPRLATTRQVTWAPSVPWLQWEPVHCVIWSWGPYVCACEPSADHWWVRTSLMLDSLWRLKERETRETTWARENAHFKRLLPRLHSWFIRMSRAFFSPLAFWKMQLRKLWSFRVQLCICSKTSKCC